MDSDFETNDNHFVIKEDFNQNITDDDDGHMIDKIDTDNDGNINDHSNDDDDSGNNQQQQQSSSSTSIMSIINNNHNNWLNIDEPVIHNVVATANFNCRLELSKIAIRVRNAEYNPKRFCAVIMRIFEPRTTALLFASGKIVITGAKNERLACLSCRKFARIVQKLGNDVKLTDFKIQNVVSTVDMKFPIRLDKLSIVHSQFCTYDPDFFPALIYRMVQPRTVLLIFVSGKLLITGARNRLQIKETMEHIGPVLCSFRK